jgi:hypothetical protein
MDSRRKQEVEKALVEQGFHAEVMDNWQPKLDLWWHRDQPAVEPNAKGRLRGDLQPNLNGHPEQQLKYSTIGLLPWPPSDTCRCKGCREARASQGEVSDAPEKRVPLPAPAEASPRPHQHNYPRTMGSKCRIPGCDRVRMVPYEKRKH